MIVSAKQLAGLIYVGIAFLAAGFATLETNGNVQWFSAVNNLDLYIGGVAFRLDGQGLGYPYIIVEASLRNPLNYNGLSLSGVNYAVFVNSTSETFAVMGSSEIANSVRGFQLQIPAGGSLNITITLSVLSDTVDPLRIFLNKHQTDLTTLIGTTLYFDSVYGTFSVPYCYQFPGNTIVFCPSSRTSGTGAFGGG